MQNHSVKQLKSSFEEDRKKSKLGDWWSEFKWEYKYNPIFSFVNDYFLYPLRQIRIGLWNYKQWYKIIWNDRQWDDSFIFEILKKKLELQREGLLNGYAADTEIVGRDIQNCINLIDRVRNEYYEDETFKYGIYDWKEDIELGTVEDYLKKYPSSVRKAKIKYADLLKDDADQKRLARYVSYVNQEKAQALLFKILNYRIRHWWD